MLEEFEYTKHCHNFTFPEKTKKNRHKENMNKHRYLKINNRKDDSCVPGGKRFVCNVLQPLCYSDECIVFWVLQCSLNLKGSVASCTLNK